LNDIFNILLQPISRDSREDKVLCVIVH